MVNSQVLAPIGTSSMNGPAPIGSTKADDETLTDSNGKKDEAASTDFSNEIHHVDSKSNDKRDKPRKMTKSETPPRFQIRKDSDDRGKNDDRKSRSSRSLPNGSKNSQKRVPRKVRHFCLETVTFVCRSV